MYTNGFDISQVLPALKNRLGWRQPTLSGSPTLNDSNKKSLSRRYFQGFHPLVTIQNILETQEDPDISEDDFNTYLDQLQDDAIMRCLNEVFRGPELIEQKLMYTRFGTMDIPINNSGMFVGYIINVANNFNISTQIKTATFYFDQDCSFNMYLFMDGILAPLKTISVTVEAYKRTTVEFDIIESVDENDEVTITDNTLVLNYKIGRKYYFGYFQSELGEARAIREQVDIWATTKCFEAYVFTAPAISNNTDFNHNYRQYGFLPYGLNLEIISFRDHTQKILRKANLFDEAQGVTVASMVLEQINMSTRSNITERQTKQVSDKIYIELNQAFPSKDVPVMPGLKARLAAEYKKLKDTFYPAAQAMSVSMESDNLGSESSWFKQNWRMITNPPIQKL